MVANLKPKRVAKEMAKKYSVLTLLVQNEISDEQVIELLVKEGLVPLEEYYYRNGKPIWKDNELCSYV